MTDATKFKFSIATASTVFALSASAFIPTQAETEIQWWHAMSGDLGEWVNDLAKDFNDTQKD